MMRYLCRIGLTWRRPAAIGWLVAAVLLPAWTARGQEYKSGLVWPEPKVVEPAPALAAPVGAPKDAIVLFDGHDLSQWDGGDKWIVKDGYAISDKQDISSKQSFGDCQLHVEWATPAEVTGSGQGRGNSGVFMMSHYEIQVLDSYQNETYYDGQAASVYKQQPPMVNASRKPGQWQTYDIIFTAPRFDAAGQLLQPAYLTLLHNGILVQNHYALQGDTSWSEPAKYVPIAPRLPIRLQFHHNPVRFRNIWVREIPPMEPIGCTAAVAPASAPDAERPRRFHLLRRGE